MQIDHEQYIETLIAGIHQEGDLSVLRPLKSVLGTVWNQQIEHFFQADRLSLDKDVILPTTTPTAIPSDFLSRANSELQQLKNLFKGHEHSTAYRYTLYYYAQVWGSRVALSNGSAHNSVFDHNRIKAAIAICQQQASDPEKPFLLIKGAIGGIQKYIYHDIKAEQIGDADKSSKRLRGRSFLVAHLSQVIAEQVIQRLGQTEAQILFVGGGHFNLLLPNVEELKSKLDQITQEINMGLQKNLGSQLSFDIVALETDNAILSNPARYFQSLNDLLDVSKTQRHRQYLPNLFYGEVSPPNESEEEQIGQEAPYAGFIVEIKADSAQTLSAIAKYNKPDIESTSFLNVHYILIRKDEGWLAVDKLLKSLASNRDQTIAVKVIRLNNTDFLPVEIEIPATMTVSWGFEFVGNYAPRGIDGIYTFEKLAVLDPIGSPTLNYPQLAAMRLDVDDLGALFAYGMGTAESLERMSNISREIQLFFGAYFNVLAESHHLYITYSGGDDAFVIGSWLNVLHFSDVLYRDFFEFTCGNPHLGFSAGVYTCNPHYPVARFAKDAEDQQKRAKKYKPDPSLAGKNAVCVFNQVYPWERYLSMLSMGKELELVVPMDSVQTVSGKPIRRSLLQRLLSIMLIAQEDENKLIGESRVVNAYRKQKDFEFFRNLGRLHGLLARQGFGANSSEEGLSARITRQILQDSVDRQRFLDYKLPFNYVLYKTSEVKTSTYGKNI